MFSVFEAEKQIVEKIKRNKPENLFLFYSTITFLEI